MLSSPIGAAIQAACNEFRFNVAASNSSAFFTSVQLTVKIFRITATSTAFGLLRVQLILHSNNETNRRTWRPGAQHINNLSQVRPSSFGDSHAAFALTRTYIEQIEAGQLYHLILLW